MSKQGKSVILDYLVEKNRPLSANDLFTSLNGQVSKASTQSCLEELANEKKIIEKTYGKQKVYMALQSTDCTNIKADLRALDEHIFVTKNELNLVKNENGRFESELKAFSDIVPIPQLERSVKAIEKEVEELKSRVADFKSAKAELVTKEEKIKIQKEREKYVKEWRKLKRISNEMMSTILENCNVKKNQLCDDLGLILDEHEKVEPPQL